jgi:hypothetical protein
MLHGIYKMKRCAKHWVMTFQNPQNMQNKYETCANHTLHHGPSRLDMRHMLYITEMLESQDAVYA